MPIHHALVASTQLLALAASPRPPAMLLTTLLRPKQPFVEEHNGTQLVNFDIRVANTSSQVFHLVGITMTVFDRAGGIEEERALDENGFPGALGIVGPLTLPAYGTEEIFQPFTTFASSIELYRLNFSLAYMRDGRKGLPVPFIADLIVPVNVFPKRFHPVAYCLPLRGRMLVQDGHDFFSHHRRLAHPLPLNAKNDTAPSANLYAEDFVRIGETGTFSTGDPRDKRHWFTYGDPVFTDAAGTVVASATAIPEHSFLPDGSASPLNDARDPKGFGNYVELAHSDGRVSWFLHMQPGSVRARPGDHLLEGVQIGLVGFSGDALFPHLHYDVTDGTAYPAQGIPVYFRDFRRIFGQRRVDVTRDSVDTGDIIEATRNCGAGRSAP